MGTPSPRSVGGTMVARILGLSRWGGPLSAYFELTGEAPPEDLKLAHQERGNALEHSVLRIWSEVAQAGFQPSLPVHSDALSHAHASVDALGIIPPDMEDRTILDAKTLAREAMGEDWGLDGTDQVPVEYQLQLLWYLGVCKAAGMQMADEALLPTLVGPEAELQWAARLVKAVGRPLALADLDGTGLELRVYRVEWDAALFAEVNARVVRFLREHVEPRVPPGPGPGDMPERDLRAVAKGLKAEHGRVLDFERLPPHEQALVLELLDANRQRKAWAEKEEQAAARVRLLMATAEEVRGLPGGARVSWKESQSGMRRFEVREPRR